MTTPYHCPECGGPLILDPDARVAVPYYVQPRGAMPYLEERLVPIVCAFCTECEFCLEVRA